MHGTGRGRFMLTPVDNDPALVAERDRRPPSRRFHFGFLCCTTAACASCATSKPTHGYLFSVLWGMDFATARRSLVKWGGRVKKFFRMTSVMLILGASVVVPSAAAIRNCVTESRPRR